MYIPRIQGSPAGYINILNAKWLLQSKLLKLIDLKKIYVAFKIYEYFHVNLAYLKNVCYVYILISFFKNGNRKNNFIFNGCDDIF